MVAGRTPSRIASSVALVFACTVAPAAQDHSGQYPASDIASGVRLYSSLCAGCHGPTGAGVSGVDLRRGPLPRAVDDAALRTVITNGFPSAGMPPFRLDPTELDGLVAFIRSGFATTEDVGVTVGDAARGRVVFESKGQCLSCHRVGNQGAFRAPDLTDIGRARSAAALQRALLDPTGSMLPINRPVRAVTEDGRVIRARRLNEDLYTVQLIDEEGRLVSLVKAELREWSIDTTSPMPSYQDDLTPEEIADVVGYLVSLRGDLP